MPWRFEGRNLERWVAVAGKAHLWQGGDALYMHGTVAFDEHDGLRMQDY